MKTRKESVLFTWFSRPMSVLAVLALACGIAAGETDSKTEKPGKTTEGQKALLEQAEPWNPYNEILDIQNRIDRLFTHALGRFEFSPEFRDLSMGGVMSPDLNLNDAGDRYEIRMDLPGMEKADIDIEIRDRVLTVSGTRKEEVRREEGEGENKMIRREVSYGNFQRSLTLPGPVYEGKAKAEYENGVLRIFVPKDREEKTEQNRVPIE
jgi:HSP20 family protein